MDNPSTTTESTVRSLFKGLFQFFSSPWVRWVGFRYLKSKKSSRFLSFITFLSFLGVGIGVTAIIVVLSVMDGFENELKKRLMATDLHILVTPLPQAPGFHSGFVSIFSTPLAVTSLQDDGRVVQVAPVISTEAILKSGKKVTGVVFKGIDAEKMKRFKSQIVELAEPQLLVDRKGEQSVKLPGVFVGQELAFEMGLIPGDKVTLVSPTETQGPMESVPRLQRFVVEGIYRSGVPEQELHVVFSRDHSILSFLRKSKVVSQWEIIVKDFNQAPVIAKELKQQIVNFKVQDWIEMNASLFFSLKLERIAMFIILAFIIIVASFNIVTTLTLMVLEKKREISILKTMGARDSQVAAVFLSEGLFIGSIGVIIGVGFAYLICFLLKKYEFISLPDVYYDRTLPVTFDPFYYFIVSVCAFLIVLLASVYPSKRAAQLHPLVGIRL